MRYKLKKIVLYLLMFVICCLILLIYNKIYVDEVISNTFPKFKTNDISLTLQLNDKNGLKTKRDWHDYNAIKDDQLRTGPGEQGAAVHVLASEQSQSAYDENGFNIMVSDRISLNRSLSDIRHSRCKRRHYLADLPSASIVIPFYEEGWSTLFRTIHSIINRTPPQLLHEIVLVDDASQKNHLKSRLDKELQKYSKVKLMRLHSREGLIRARLTGINHSTGDVVVILDSHIEVTHNWLPPLLEPIAMDRKTITCPMIDIIDMNDFHYLTQPGDAMRGAFDWELYYKRIPIPPEKLSSDPSDPFEDPVMAGGLFAVDRTYFKEIGQYDSGLEIWGGEQYELSFKVWMCGGRILDAPCSRVGHIYRKFMPYSIPPGVNLNKNFRRVAEVWMDEYKEYFYKKRPFVLKIDPGDIENQKQLRKDLKCKSFHWYMTEIAPDIIKHYPPVIPEPAAWGKLMNKGTNLCVDGRYGGEGNSVVLSPCKKKKGLADQELLLTWKEDIRLGGDMNSARKVCLDSPDGQVILWNCHGQYGNQLWKYQPDLSRLLHSVTGKCLTADEKSGRVSLAPCSYGNAEQMWLWEHSDTQRLEKLNKKLNVPVEVKI